MTLGTESKIELPVVKDLLVRAVSSVVNHNRAIFVLPFLNSLVYEVFLVIFPVKVYGPVRFGKHRKWNV